MKDQAVGNSRVEKGISDQASQSRLAFIVAKVRSATREARRGRLAETSRVSQLHLFANSLTDIDASSESRAGLRVWPCGYLCLRRGIDVADVDIAARAALLLLL